MPCLPQRPYEQIREAKDSEGKPRLRATAVAAASATASSCGAGAGCAQHPLAAAASTSAAATPPPWADSCGKQTTNSSPLPGCCSCQLRKVKEAPRLLERLTGMPERRDFLALQVGDACFTCVHRCTAVACSLLPPASPTKCCLQLLCHTRLPCKPAWRPCWRCVTCWCSWHPLAQPPACWVRSQQRQQQAAPAATTAGAAGTPRRWPQGVAHCGSRPWRRLRGFRRRRRLPAGSCPRRACPSWERQATGRQRPALRGRGQQRMMRGRHSRRSSSFPAFSSRLPRSLKRSWCCVSAWTGGC